MKKKAIIILHMATVAISGLDSCCTNQEIVDIHNSRISLDWAGVYKGIVQYNESSYIEVRLKLNYDDSFELRLVYLNNSRNPINWEGSFKWDNTGNIIILDIVDAPLIYRVTSNKLIRLDIKEKQIKGKPANEQVLIKEQ